MMVGLALAGVLIVPAVVDWNHFKAPISEGLRTLTARQVSLEGDVRFAVLPVPTLSVAGVRIGNPPGYDGPDQLHLARLDARLALLPLLAGRIEVEHIALEQPELWLEPRSDERQGWFSRPALPPGLQLVQSIRFDRVEIHNGTLVWHDSAQSGETRLTGIHARISANSLAGPFELIGRGESAGLALTFEAATGAIGKWASTPIRLAVSTLDGKNSLHFAGLAAAGDSPRLQGDLRVESSAVPSLLAQAFDLEPPGQELPLSLHAALDASDHNVNLTGIDLLSGAAALAGQIRLNLSASQPPALEVKLTAGRLDLPPWLGSASALSGLRLPPALTAGLDLSVDALGLGPVLLRQATLRARLSGGGLTLEQLTALGPGGSEFVISGTVASGAAGVADLRFNASADNLRMLLDQFSLDSSGVPGDRLRRAALSGRLRGNADALRLTGLDLALDTSRMTGEVEFHHQGRAALSARLDVDHIDLEAYRAGLSPPDLRRLAGQLSDIDISLAARLGLLSLGNVTARGLEADATTNQGALTVRSLLVGDLAGLSFSLNGSAAGLEPPRGIDLAFKANTESLATAERVFGLSLPPPFRRMGALKLGGHLAGDSARLALALNADGESGPTALSAEIARDGSGWRISGLHGTLAGTALKGDGRLDLANSVPAFELRLKSGEIGLDRLWPETQHPTLYRWSLEPLDFGWLGGVSGQLSLGAAALSLSGRRLSGATLEARLGDGTLTLDRLEGELLGGRLSARGRLTRTPSGAGEATANLTLDGIHFDHGLLEGYPAPATVDLTTGALNLETSLSARGASELALVGSLAGTGRFLVSTGRLHGIDLPGLSQRVAKLRQAEDVASRLSLGRGEPEGDTPFERLDSAFAIEHGIVTLSGLRLAAESGSAEAEGELDLPNRLINLVVHLHPDLLPPNRQPTPPPSANVMVTGGFERLQRTIDTDALQSYLIKSLLAR